jgi:hypothetical protein
MALCRFAGERSTGSVDFTCEYGTTWTPSVGAELSATAQAPKPWSSRIWVKAPPAEWPMMIGGFGSGRMTASRCSMMAGTVSAVMMSGLALRASTSTSKPGYPGAMTRKPFCS